MQSINTVLVKLRNSQDKKTKQKKTALNVSWLDS